MDEFTREYLDNARKTGYADDEIIAHITQGRPDIRSALESGTSLDQVADYLTAESAKKQEAQKAEAEKDPSLGQVGAGLAAQIAVAEGAKYAGATAGAGWGAAASAPTLGAASPITVPVGSAIGYTIGALGGGWTGSVLAQKIEGKENIDYGRATIDTLLNLIPFGRVATGESIIAKTGAALAKRPIAAGAAIGAVATPAYMASEELQGKKEYTLEDYLKGAGTSAALGAGLGVGEKVITAGIRKIRNKTPEQINQLIEAGDPTTIEMVDTMTAGLTPEQVKATPKDVSEYIQNMTKVTTAKVAPSRVVGYDATTAVNKAKSSVEAVQGTAANIGKQIDDYLAKNPEHKEGAIAFLDGEDRPDLPPELLEKLVYGRSKIRNEQQRMLDMYYSGEKRLPADRAEMIEASLNKGDYLTRSYEFFQNPNYKPSKEKHEALKRSLVENGMDEASANKYLAELQTKMKGNPEDFAQFMQGPGTPKVFKQRKEVSQELEDYLGLIKEPGQRTKATISILNRINEYNQADARIAKALFDSGAAVKAADASAQGLLPLNLKRGAAILDGEELYVDPAVQTAINKLYATKLDEKANLVSERLMSDIYQTMVSGLKSAKVLGNIPSYLIQAPSNLAITLAAGMNPALGLRNAVEMSLGSLAGTRLGSAPVIKKFANQASPLTMQKFENLKKRGIITGNIAFEDISAGLQGKRIGRAFQKATDTPGRIYSIPDNIFRVVNYENNADVLRKIAPTATSEQIEEMAARLTKKTYPNYDSVSPEIKALSRAGVMPQFVTYSVEFARSQLAQAKAIKNMLDGSLVSKLGDEFKDIPVNTAALKKEGAKKMAAMIAAYTAATYGLNEFNRRSFSEEEERAYRDTVAKDFERDKPLMLYRNKDGTIGSVNMSYYMPQTILGNTVMAALRGEDVDESAQNLAKLFGTELVGEGSFAAQALSSLASGRDFKTGELISNDPTTMGNLADRFGNLGKEFVPLSVTAMQRPDKTMQEKLKRQAGIREEKTTVADGFGFKARAVHEAVGNIKSAMSKHQYALQANRLTPEQHQQLVSDEQNNYVNSMQKMVEHVKNLKTLGETDNTIIPMLQQAKFSSNDILNLLDGKVVPYDPTKQKTTSEYLDEITGNDDAETRKNIRDLIRKDSVLGQRVLSAYREKLKNRNIVLSPKEQLLASLPTPEKVERVLPQIQSSVNPEGEIRRLLKKKILTQSDLEAIRIRRKTN